MSSTLSKDEIYYPSAKGIIRSIDEYKRHYLASDLDFNRLGKRKQKTLKLVSEVTRQMQTGRWLDYGCGGGVFPYHLGKMLPSWQVEGWDADESSIKIAEACFGLPNVRFELRSYASYTEVEPGSYNAVSFLEVIEHVPNPGEMLRGFHRALAPKGRLILSTPHCFGSLAVNAEARRWINQRIGRRSKPEYVELLNSAPYNPAIETGHISIYNVPTLATLLKAHGFRLLSFSFATNGRGLLSRVLPDTIIMAAEKT